MMHNTHTIILLFTLLISGITAENQRLPLSKLARETTEQNATYERGEYLIILPNSAYIPYLTDPQAGDFIAFKNSQGFDATVIALDTENLSTALEIKAFLQSYYASHPMLEYVLLVGDVNGSLAIPTFFIHSVNEDEEDVTDYPYSYFDNDAGSETYDVLNPAFLVGRWSVRNGGDIRNIKARTIQYSKMDYLNESDKNYLNNGLLVAGNYKTSSDGNEVPPSTWPVTPVWTSHWLMDRLQDFGYTQIDTAFFHAGYQVVENPTIVNAWTSGVGIINYRGWGNSHGWHKPLFHIEDIEDINNGWKLPVVMSLVCNTGDFGADIAPQTGPEKCFGEDLLTRGSVTNPKGAVAVVGPSDLDTDTKFNNVICGAMWDELLDERLTELGPALFAGKQSMIHEFPHLTSQGDVVEFYHHIYGVLGDPSLPVWLRNPGGMSASIENNINLHQSFLHTQITDDTGTPLEFVVGALMLDGSLIAKGLSTPDGTLSIDFSDVPIGSTMDLYLNKSQFMQKHIQLTFTEDDGSPFNPDVYAEFDVTPILDSGVSWLSSNTTETIALNISNSTSESFQNMEVSLTTLSEEMINVTTDNISLDLLPYTAVTTEILLTGTVGNIPVGFRLPFRVEFSLNGNIIAEKTIHVLVGPVEENNPSPSDEYGYWAYDSHDNGYVETPVYNWVELNPENGGSGTNLNLTDDTQTTVDISFPFTYYGQAYFSANVCSNGWLSFEESPVPYFWNFSIPMSLGPPAMVAPFCDDLDDNNGTEPFNVFYLSETDRFIIQWDAVSNGEDDEFCPNCVKETFQVILLNPAVYPTTTGDGEIIFQYQEIHDIDANGNFSTIGIESPSQNGGLQYLFSGQLSPGASALENGLAIKFTTDAPTEVLAINENTMNMLANNYILSPSYPNPFNPTTTITFSIPVVETRHALSLQGYDITGRLVETLAHGITAPGTHTVKWDASEFSSGVYFVHMVAGDYSKTQKVLLLK